MSGLGWVCLGLLGLVLVGVFIWLLRRYVFKPPPPTCWAQDLSGCTSDEFEAICGSQPGAYPECQKMCLGGEIKNPFCAQFDGLEDQSVCETTFASEKCAQESKYYCLNPNALCEEKCLALPESPQLCQNDICRRDYSTSDLNYFCGPCRDWASGACKSDPESQRVVCAREDCTERCSGACTHTYCMTASLCDVCADIGSEECLVSGQQASICNNDEDRKDECTAFCEETQDACYVSTYCYQHCDKILFSTNAAEPLVSCYALGPGRNSASLVSSKTTARLFQTEGATASDPWIETASWGEGKLFPGKYVNVAAASSGFIVASRDHGQPTDVYFPAGGVRLVQQLAACYGAFGISQNGGWLVMISFSASPTDIGDEGSTLWLHVLQLEGSRFTKFWSTEIPNTLTRPFIYTTQLVYGTDPRPVFNEQVVAVDDTGKVVGFTDGTAVHVFRASSGTMQSIDTGNDEDLVPFPEDVVWPLNTPTWWHPLWEPFSGVAPQTLPRSYWERAVRRVVLVRDLLCYTTFSGQTTYINLEDMRQMDVSPIMPIVDVGGTIYGSKYGETDPIYYMSDNIPIWTPHTTNVGTKDFLLASPWQLIGLRGSTVTMRQQ